MMTKKTLGATKSRGLSLGAIVVLAFGFPPQSQSVIMFFTDRAAWESAAAPPSFAEDFLRVLEDTPFHSAPLALNGITIQQAGSERMSWNEVDVAPFQFTPNSGSQAALLLTNLPENGSSGIQVDITFTDPNRAFAFSSWSANDGEGVVLEVFDRTALLGSKALGGGNGAFLGYVLTGADASTAVRLRSARLVQGVVGERFYIDDLAGKALARTDNWTRKADIPTARTSLATCVINAKIYAVGGAPHGQSSSMDTAESYDPLTDSWTTKASMPTSRAFLACAAVNGKIYAIGGSSVFLGPSLNTVEEYNPAKDQWVQKTDMPTARQCLAAAAVDGKIYVIGGFTSGGAPLGTLEVYDPATDSWQTKASMPTRRGFLSVSVLDAKIYAMGASGPGLAALPTVEMYDPLTDTWTSKANLPTARGALASATAHGRIYVMGGRTPDGVNYATLEEYDPIVNKWIKRADMRETPTGSASRRHVLAAAEVNGRIYAIGGALSVSAPQAVPLVLEYSPPIFAPMLQMKWVENAGERVLNLEWSSRADCFDILQFQNQLRNGSWTEVQRMSGTGHALTKEIPGAEPAAFYRVQRELR